MYEGARHAAQLHYSFWVQRPDAYQQPDDGEIKRRTVRFGRSVVFAWVFGAFRTLPRFRAPCAPRPYS